MVVVLCRSRYGRVVPVVQLIVVVRQACSPARAPKFQPEMDSFRLSRKFRVWEFFLRIVARFSTNSSLSLLSY
jgi:hypothetical protein